MRIITLCFCLISWVNPSHAQIDSVEKIYAFKITGYIKSFSDSASVVQVIKPATSPLIIKEKQIGSLFHCYKPGEKLDTAIVGWGRCQLIKGEYYYFGITHNKMQQPVEGDLIYMLLKLPVRYNGLLLKVMNHALEFTNVYGEPFISNDDIFTNTQKNEQAVLDSMVNDIHYTGKAMLEQMPEQNKILKGGIYDGKKLFEAMQTVKRTELEQFLKYISARPKNYAGNIWKISETFATWMDSATPTVVQQ